MLFVDDYFGFVMKMVYLVLLFGKVCVVFGWFFMFDVIFFVEYEYNDVGVLFD